MRERGGYLSRELRQRLLIVPIVVRVAGSNYPHPLPHLPKLITSPLGSLNEESQHTNRSQFFITLNPCYQYHKRYVGFGKVLNGLPLLKKYLKKIQKLQQNNLVDLEISNCYQLVEDGKLRTQGRLPGACEIGTVLAEYRD